MKTNRTISITQTPHRLSLAGATDLKPFVSRYGGSAFAVTIDKYVVITLARRRDSKIHLVYPDRTEIVDNVEKIKHPIIKAALIKYGLTQGIGLHSHSDIVPKSGLGSSGAFTVGLVNAIYWLKGIKLSPNQLAEEAAHLEVNLLGSPIGKYDHYMAAFGGFLQLVFKKNGQVVVKPVRLSPETVVDLSRHIVLVHTNISRDAKKVLSKSMAQLSEEEKLTKTKEFKSMTDRLRELLQDGATKEFAVRLQDLMAIKKVTHPGSITPAVQQFFDAGFAAGAIGIKNIGAGGGGFIYYYIPENKQTELISVIERQLMGTVYPFQFTAEGSKILH